MTHPTLQFIDVHQLKTCCENNPGACVIDVREHDEWQAGRIPGTVHIPKDEIKQRIHDITQDKNFPIYLHCKSGRRSQFAGECLCEMGFTNVYSVEGGIMDWMMAGYPIEK